MKCTSDVGGGYYAGVVYVCGCQETAGRLLTMLCVYVLLRHDAMPYGVDACLLIVDQPRC